MSFTPASYLTESQISASNKAQWANTHNAPPSQGLYSSLASSIPSAHSNREMAFNSSLSYPGYATHLPGFQSMTHEPVRTYVNPKQYLRILKRRQVRALLAARRGNITKENQTQYEHESRHKHAKKRARNNNGRFLTKEEQVTISDLSSQGGGDSSSSSSSCSSSSGSSVIRENSAAVTTQHQQQDDTTGKSVPSSSAPLSLEDTSTARIDFPATTTAEVDALLLREKQY
jgi:hypothetical protein